MKCLNVVFSDIAHGMVREFLKDGSRSEEVAIVSSDSHLRPIAYSNYLERNAWARANLGFELVDSTTRLGQSDALFETATRDGLDIFAWVDFSSSAEYANFLHWMSRKKPVGFFVVKPIQLAPTQQNGAIRDRSMPSLDYVRNSANAVMSSDLEEFETSWKILEGENAAFRLLDKTGQLRSLDIAAFDDVLTDSVRAEWELMPTVVLRAMNECWSSGRCFPGDLFF